MDFTETFLLCILLSTLIYLIVYIITLNNSTKILKSLTQELDPDKYLEAINKKISKCKKEKNKEMLKVNKTAGLIEKGNFEEAIELLKTIDINNLSLPFKVAYEINMIAALYSSDKIKEANELYKEKENFFNELILKHKQFTYPVMHLKVSYNYYTGNYNETKGLINELQKNKLSKASYINLEYILGLTEIREGNIEEGKRRLELLLKPTEKLYIHKVIEKQLQL